MNDVEKSLLCQWYKQRKLVMIWRAIARRCMAQINILNYHRVPAPVRLVAMHHDGEGESDP